MADFKYDEEKFNNSSKKIIDKMIENNIDEEIINFTTQLNGGGTQIFSSFQMEEILSGALQKLSFNDIKKYAVVHNGHCVYSTSQMNSIRKGIIHGLSNDKINIYAKLNSDKMPIFNPKQMNLISSMLIDKFPKKYIDQVTLLNKENEPVYSWEQIGQIRNGIATHLDKSKIDYYSQLNDSGTPVYSDAAMCYIRYAFNSNLPIEYINIFARTRDGKQVFGNGDVEKMYKYIMKLFREDKGDVIKQLKGCVDDNLTFKQIRPFIESELSSDKIRLLRTFYGLGASIKDIKPLIDKNTSYDDLKEIKYLLQCAKTVALDKDVVLDENLTSIVEKRVELSEYITAMGANSQEAYEEYKELVNRCLSYKMPPEQIYWIAQIEDFIEADVAKEVAIGFLNGMTVEEFQNMINQYTTSMEYGPEELIKDINKIISNKNEIYFDLDEYVNIETQSNDIER